MHILFVHKNFPAQFGHVARYLIERHGYQCTFVSELPDATIDGIRRIGYKTNGLASAQTHYCSRTFENYVWHSNAVYETLKARPDVRPDLVVGHSGFGSTVFLRDLYECPIINYFEWYYRAVGSDMDFRTDFPVSELNRLRARTRNAMLLLDLQTCTLGYSPTNWQRTRLPSEYEYKLSTIFDGIDTTLWRRSEPPADQPRVVAGRTISPETRIVTYVSRGFESMRGFDIFMHIAKRIYERRGDVVFVCVGSDRVCYGGDTNHIEEPSFRHHVLAQDKYDLERFIFTGQVAPAELARIFNLSDLHIYLTVPFVLSWSMMNAMACGSTVLASATPPVLEMIEHERNGLLADFFDVDRFVELALNVLDDPPAYRRLGKAGEAMIRERYSVDVCLPKMVELYRRSLMFVERKADGSCLCNQRQIQNEPPYPMVSVPAHAPRKVCIHTTLMAPKACEHVRVHEPNRLLQTIPGVRVSSSVATLHPSIAHDDEHKVLILQRPILRWPDCVGTLRTLRSQGYLIVVEYDDDPARRPEHHANQFLTFRACHAVQTSTHQLSDAIRKWNPHVAVFHNQIADLPSPRRYQDNSTVHIFFGALNRERDWAPILPALNRLCRNYGERLDFHVVHDKAFYDVLKASRKSFTPFCDYHEYKQILSQCDIGLLPLEAGSVNACKSDLKFIECAARGVVVVASPTVYEESVTDGVSGYIYRGPDDFYRKVATLIDNVPLRRCMAGSAYDFVYRQRQLVQHVGRRYDWYVSLLDNLSRLDDELGVRSPELEMAIVSPATWGDAVHNVVMGCVALPAAAR